MPVFALALAFVWGSGLLPERVSRGLPGAESLPDLAGPLWPWGVTPAHAQSAKSTLEDPEQAAMFNRVSDRLMCQCGCNMILRVCNHFECPSAIPMRAEIERQIVAGESEDAIVASFVEEHGKVVLATPPAEGIDLAAWVMPGFSILIGLLLTFYVVSSWLAKKKVKPATPTADLDPSLTSRIEEELKRMDG